jgi:Flp pilus assembly protein TadG
MKDTAPENQKGFVLVVVAILLIVLIGFVALGVDTGALYSARTSAQEVADAAALAGAFTYIKEPKNANPAALATNDALLVATNNSVMGKPVTAGDVTVTPDVANRRVTVEVRSAQPTYFARAIWGDTANIATTATAEAAENSSAASCVKPWFIPNTIFMTNPVCTGQCNPNQLLVNPVPDGDGKYHVTTFGENQQGQSFRLKPQNPHDAIAPGQFYAIDIPNDLNGDDYRNNIETCTNALVRCHQTYSVLTGNRVGPTKLGVADLIGDPPRFTYVSPGHYQTYPTGPIVDISENVVVAPIWDPCALTGFCPAGDFPNGTMVELKVIGFAIIFLKGIDGDDVEAVLLGVSACGATGNGDDPGQGGGTVLSFPLRLVRVP